VGKNNFSPEMAIWAVIFFGPIMKIKCRTFGPATPSSHTYFQKISSQDPQG